MKREIKFRAWDGETMIYDCTPFRWDFVLSLTMHKCTRSTGSGFLGSGGKEATFELNGYRRDPDAPLMQYTGLKDKNGVEIYEGDILHCHEYDSSDCGRRIVQTFKNAVVGFGQGNYYYYPKGNMKQPHQLLMYAYKPEVIGNIFQNPELLKP